MLNIQPRPIADTIEIDWADIGSEDKVFNTKVGEVCKVEKVDKDVPSF